MAIDVIDTIKPKSDFHVAEAPDIDMKGKRLDKVVEKLQENIKTIAFYHLLSVF